MPTSPFIRTRFSLLRSALLSAAITALIAVFLASAPAARPAAAAEGDAPAAVEERKRIDDLEKKIDALTKQLADARASGSGVPADRLAELERRLDVLAAELEKLRAGSPSEDTSLSASHGH